VTRSEFLRAIADEFGEVQGRALCRDVVIQSLDNRTADVALTDGEAPKAVWAALCEVMGVATHRRHGVGLRTPLD
jgi:hypothetical protein